MNPRKFAYRSLLFQCAAVLLPITASTAIAQTEINPCGVTGGSNAIVYDSIQGVCWLADANLAAGQAMQAQLGVAGVNPNGTMNFAAAQNWVTALNAYKGVGYLGHNNWQLPVAPLQDSTCAATGTGGGSFGPLCSGSAMGNLYYLGLNLSFPNSVAPGAGAAVAPLQDMKLSYYWAQQNNGGTGGTSNGGQEVYAFSNGTQGGVTIKYPYYYVLPMVAGPIGTPPTCPAGSGVMPYTSGSAAGKAVYDCITGYTWAADANLAARNNFGITGDTAITGANGTITAPLIDGGAMLFDTANQWIIAMNNSRYLSSNAWQLPPASADLKNLFTDLHLVSGDARLAWTGRIDGFQNLQPFYYWGCQRPQSGNSQSACTGFAPPDGAQQMQWTFNFNDGFQGTASTVQRFFVMVYYPAPPRQACSTPMQCCVQAGGYWSNGRCE